MIRKPSILLECLVLLLLNTEAVIEGGRKAHSLLEALKKQARQKGREHRYKFLIK